jgi:arsenate reductase
MLAAHGGQLRRLFNTSGQDYRAMGLKDRLPTMDVDQALRLLASHGNLVRRPFLIGPGIALVGFDAAAWAAALQA